MALTFYMVSLTWEIHMDMHRVANISKRKVSKYKILKKCCAHLFHNLSILVLRIKGHGKLIHLIKITYGNIFYIIHESIAWFLYIQLQIIWNISGYEHVWKYYMEHAHVLLKTSIVLKISYAMLRKRANHSYS